MTEKKQLGRILLKQQAISPEQLEQALNEPGGRLASRLTEQGTISGLAALKALSEQHGIPGIDLEQVCVKLSDLELMPREIAERHLILPVLSRGDRLFVAMANPREKKVIDELEFVTGKRVYPYVALERPLERTIADAYAAKTRGEEYYIGEACPPETLEKLGLTRPTASAEGDTDQDGMFDQPRSARPLSSSLPPNLPSSLPPTTTRDYARAPLSAPPESPGIRADDELAPPEVAYEDFGDLNAELSIVSDLPEQQPSAAAASAKVVLVVDDEAEIRRMLDKLLSGRGYRVLTADAGHMALRMVKEHAPDLIVLDAMLPEVHGFDIARRIKGSKRYGHIPIVMVSAVYRGWHYAEDLKQSCGVEAFIEKPFKIQDVVNAVEGALRGQAGRVEVDPEAMHQEAERALTEGVAAYKDGRLDDAVALLLGGVQIDPLAYRLHFHLGLLYGRKGMVFDAIAALEQAVEINSRHFPAVKNLAILYQKAGFRHKAAEMWHKAVVIAPDEETRQTVKQQLLSLL
ncbi:MAG TPA: response regulator [Polyangiaceae bacterium]|nr:response regulator [Polyangiaceae bacterium]